MEFVPVLRWHGQHHPFLGLGDPDLGVGEALVFQRRPLQPDLHSQFLSHLADGTAEATGSAIGDRRIEFPVTGLEDHIDDHLFGDGVSDLDRTAGEFLALVGQFGR